MFNKCKYYLYIVLVYGLFFNFIYPSYERELLGDLNEDGQIDVIDVISLVNAILSNEFLENGDLNSDGINNIIDVVEIVNIILYFEDYEPSENSFGTQSSLDIVTWNIEHFPKNSSTVDTLIHIIPELFVDIIALQEIESSLSLNQLRAGLGTNWVSYIAEENSSWGELAYLINTNEVEITVPPYEILSQYSYYFAYRPPFAINITYQNHDYVIINVHYKCCDGSEDRRLQSSVYLDNYISQNLSNEKVIVVGDYNDLLIDNPNVFTPFLNNPNEYQFTDYYIAQVDMINEWSFPSWPSHLDHILITNELFNLNQTTETILIDNLFFNSTYNYDTYLSDHRPVGIRITY